MAVTLDQLQSEDDAYAKQVVDQQAAQKTKETFQPDTQKAEPSFISKFMTATGRVSTDTLDWAVNAADSINKWRGRVGQDVGAGLVTGAANIADAAGSAISSSGKGLAAAEDPAHAEDAEEGSLPTSPIWDHAKSAILDFRDAIAVKDPTLSDNLIQGAAQLAVPFTGYSRALSGLHGFANLVAANALTDATALGPHDARMADLISLGRHVEGKLGTALSALSPNGSAQNAYINYLADRGDETEAEGRFKNVLDGFGANAIVTPLFHAVASALKHGTAGLRHAVENGITSTSDMAAQPSAVAEGYQRLDMSMTPEQRAFERERIAAARDREEGVAQDVVPEPISRRAAETEGEAARRDRADQGVAAMAAPAASKSMESDGAVTAARTFLKAQTGAGHEGSLHAMVTTLGQHIDGSSADGAFYKDILGRLSAKNLETKITSPGQGAHPAAEAAPKNAGEYSHVEDTMALYPHAFRDNATLVHTVAHEAVHAATVRAINETPAVESAITGILKEAKSSDLYNRLGGEGLGKKQDRYGFTNAKEFVAEAESNPRFQQMLKTTKSADGRPLWDQYKEVIGGIFGITGAALLTPQFDKLLTKEKENS